MRNHIRLAAQVACVLGAVAAGLAVAADGPSAATKPPASAPASGPASGPATRPVDPKAVAALVSKLADASFEVRETATKKLIAMGEGVRPFMEEALKDKSLELEAVTRIKSVLARTAPPPKEARTVTDRATGITVSITDDGSGIAATQNGRMLWKFMFGGLPPTSLKIVDGQVVVSPSNVTLDLATGKAISVGPR
ncbi:MAG: hypothetical protein ACE15C_10405 [Phycisphaerae bacterium]